MELYFIRHGIAEDTSEYEDDRMRPLTDKGRIKTEKVAQRLVQLEIKFDLILTSPLIRAKQTAKILHRAGLSSILEESHHLAPEGSLQNWLKSHYPASIQTIALVGHQPNLANWAEQLIWGSPQDKLILKKAGIIGVELPSIEETLLNKGELFLLVSPKWILE